LKPSQLQQPGVSEARATPPVFSDPEADPVGIAATTRQGKVRSSAVGVLRSFQDRNGSYSFPVSCVVRSTPGCCGCDGFAIIRLLG